MTEPTAKPAKKVKPSRLARDLAAARRQHLRHLQASKKALDAAISAAEQIVVLEAALASQAARDAS